MSADVDIAVLGAGPAGANAALAASNTGASVLLIDEQPDAGGQVWRAKGNAIVYAPTTPETKAGNALRSGLGASAVTHLAACRLWQIERVNDIWHLRVLQNGKVELRTARSLILAPGAREFIQPISGWTTPGVLGLAGATALFKQELHVPGKQTVVSGTGPLIFFVASEIRRLGGNVAAVITPNRRRDWFAALPAMLARPDLLQRGALWLADLMLARIPILWGQSVTQIAGDDRVSGVTVQKLDRSWAPVGAKKEIKADSVCLGHGLIPNLEPAQLAGAQIKHIPDLGGWVPEAEADGRTCIQGLYLCGDAAGIRGAAAAEIQGRMAGLAAALDLGKSDQNDDLAALIAKHRKATRFGMAMTRLSVPRSGLAKLTEQNTIVCRCENLKALDVLNEIAGGAASTNAVKSGLRAGMGPCGGKFCQTTVQRMIAVQRGVAESDVPPPTPRPPLRAVPVSAMAGNFRYEDLPIPKPAPL